MSSIGQSMAFSFNYNAVKLDKNKDNDKDTIAMSGSSKPKKSDSIFDFGMLDNTRNSESSLTEGVQVQSFDFHRPVQEKPSLFEKCKDKVTEFFSAVNNADKKSSSEHIFKNSFSFINDQDMFKTNNKTNKAENYSPAELVGWDPMEEVNKILNS